MTSAHQDPQAADNTACPSPDRLLQYTDRQLALQEMEEVRAHLLHCPECAELAILMDIPEQDRAPDLSVSARKKDQKFLARQLGLTETSPWSERLKTLVTGLWTIRTPILVPVGMTALLLFMLLPSDPTVNNVIEHPVRFFTEATEKYSTDTRLRNSGPDYQAVAGALLTVRHHPSRAGLKPGDPVSVVVSGSEIQPEVTETRLSADGMVNLSLTITRPGQYQFTYSDPQTGRHLSDHRCSIIPPPAR